MATTMWVRGGFSGVALLVAFSSALSAREAVRTVPLVAVAATEDRNLADTRPAANEAARPSAQASRGELSVSVNRAKVIRLPEKTQTVIIGNPGVADIAIQKSGVVVLTGKSFGVTNFIALDASGGMIGESMVSVTAPSDATLTVQRGLERQTYSCTPACQPTLALGDANGYYSETKGQVDQNSAFVATR